MADWYDERHPAGADRFFSDFQAAVQVLHAFPNAGRARPDLRDGLRSYVVHPYLVFYVVDDDRKAVVIERVLHGATDISSENFESG